MRTVARRRALLAGAAALGGFAAPGRARAAWGSAPIASTLAYGGYGGTSVTTPPVDCTGANLIVIAVGDQNLASQPLDSLGNTYVYATGIGNVTGGKSSIWFCARPSVGAGMTFGMAVNATITVQAWPGAAGAPLDKTISNAGVGFGAPTGQSGPITPSAKNELVIAVLSGGYSTAIAIDSGFTIPPNNTSGSQYSGQLTMAYLVQATGAASNPTWSSGAIDPANAMQASFLPGGGNVARSSFFGGVFP